MTCWGTQETIVFCERIGHVPLEDLKDFPEETPELQQQGDDETPKENLFRMIISMVHSCTVHACLVGLKGLPGLKHVPTRGASSKWGRSTLGPFGTLRQEPEGPTDPWSFGCGSVVLPLRERLRLRVLDRRPGELRSCGCRGAHVHAKVLSSG